MDNTVVHVIRDISLNIYSMLLPFGCVTTVRWYRTEGQFYHIALICPVRNIQCLTSIKYVNDAMTLIRAVNKRASERTCIILDAVKIYGDVATSILKMLICTYM